MNNKQSWNHVDEAIDWIHSLLMFGIKPGLKRMEWMLERLSHPERRLKFIHIGGTNGKGSTLSFMRHVLEHAGYDVGTFTSPYIERFQNRIQLNGQDIPDEDLLRLAQQIKPLVEELGQTELGSPTEFEVLTILAILYFAKVAYPDYVLWEVGLGGRLDSTNVVMPILSVITNVGYDHMHILGDTLEQIATEKAGIIKPGVPVVTGIQEPELLAIIQQKAQETKSSVYALGQAFHIEEGAFTEHSQFFSLRSMFRSLEEIEIRMKGKHQITNAAVALMALEVINQYYAVVWSEDELRKGLQQTSWMGRMETVAEQPLTIIDGAHNVQGMEAFQQSVKRYYADKHVTVFFTALKDKQLPKMLSYLDGVVNEVIVTTFDFPRAPSTEEIHAQLTHSPQWSFDIRIVEDWATTYEQLRKQASEADVFFFTGSLYFISEVRQHFLAHQ